MHAGEVFTLRSKKALSVVKQETLHLRDFKLDFNMTTCSSGVYVNASFSNLES